MVYVVGDAGRVLGCFADGFLVARVAAFDGRLAVDYARRLAVRALTWVTTRADAWITAWTDAGRRRHIRTVFHYLRQYLGEIVAFAQQHHNLRRNIGNIADLLEDFLKRGICVRQNLLG